MKLSPTTRGSITPLIEVAEFLPENPEQAYDFEEGKPPRTIDKHLAPFAHRLISKWGSVRCFVDLRRVSESARMANGQHPVAFVFDALRAAGADAVPVMGILQDPTWQEAITATTVIDQRGVCWRFSLEEVTEADFARRLDRLLRNLDTNPEQSDLVLDLGAPPNFEPLDGFAGLLQSILRSLPHIDRWRSLSLVGTSFPKSLSGFNAGLTLIPRNEWRLYKRLFERLETANQRIPNFGDYAIHHPDVANIDPRVMKPKANIRYTVDDGWLIARGARVRDYSEQKALCSSIVKSSYYSGDSFSAGDKYILDCAKSEVSTGNATTWRQVGTSHHLEMVARDVANLFASADTR